MQIVFRIILFIVGACFGSFLCCQARRLHYREDKSHNTKKLNPRSICLHCKKQLKWYDNLPIFSWLLLRGKCRYCHQKIGLAELLSELGLGLAFLLLGFNLNPIATPLLDWIVFIIALIFTTVLSFLAIYDGLYGELPTIFLILAIVLACIHLAVQTCMTINTTGFTPAIIWQPLASVAILGGLYLLLYLISKGKWVGDGDWLLATAIAIVLATPVLALITLFLANFLATLVMLPFIKGNKTHKIHFGPFLILAFVITYAFSTFFITFML